MAEEFSELRTIGRGELPREEGERVEFKEQWTETAKKTLVAFANGAGGTVWFGINDRGEAAGLSESPDSLRRSVSSFARNGVEPPLSGLISMETVWFGRRPLLAVRVAAGRSTPYAFKGRLLKDGVYVRDGSCTILANREELIALLKEGDPIPWEARLCLKGQLTFEQAAAVFAERDIPFGEPWMNVLGITDDAGEFTQLGFLLSDQNSRTASAGEHLGEDETLSGKREFAGSLLKQITDIFQFFKAVNPVLLQKKPGRLASEEKRAWPEAALREALVNSLVHRDYEDKEPTKINVYPDRIEFLSYGGIPGGLSVEDIRLEGTSKCRNEKLAQLFQRLGWMEKFGTGLPDIWRCYRGSAAEPRIIAGRRAFSIVLPRLELPAENPKERLRQLFAQREEWTPAELELALSVSRSWLNAALRELIAEGLVRRLGGGRSTRYARAGGAPGGLMNAV